MQTCDSLLQDFLTQPESMAPFVTKTLKIIFFTGSVNVLISQRPIESAQMNLHLGWHQFVFGWLMFYFSTNIGIGLLNVWEKNFSIKQNRNWTAILLCWTCLFYLSPLVLCPYSQISIWGKREMYRQPLSPPPPPQIL